MKKLGLGRKLLALGFGVALLASNAGLFPFVPKAQAAEFTNRSLQMSDSLTGATATYKLTLTGKSSAPLGVIRLQLCVEDPFPGLPCTAPAGLDFTAASLISQSGMTGFSISSETTTNEIVLTRTAQAGSTVTSVYELSGVVNSSQSGIIYGRLETFAGPDTSSAVLDAAGLAVSYSDSQIVVNTVVPPYLLFCIAEQIQPYDCSTAQGNYLDFGELRPTATASGQIKLLVATNAEYGYAIRAQGTTLTSGVNVIPALTTPDISRVGVSQFGMNLRANSTPPSGQNPAGLGEGLPASGYNTPNLYKFVPGEVFASNYRPDNYRMYTANYIVNVSRDQPPGVYVTTLTFVALATF